MKQFLIIVVILIIAALGLYFVVGGGADTTDEQATTTDATTTQQNDFSNEGQDQPTDESDATTTATGTDEQAQDQDSADETVRYTDQGFEPASVTVSEGETVRFVSETNTQMWVASDEHPTHANYDETTLNQHCDDEASDSFDQCESGDSFTFTFDKVGEWQYHNHLNANDGGTVVVE